METRVKKNLGGQFMRKLITLALFVFSPISFAVPITWHLDAVTSDGGTLSGSFVFDADAPLTSSGVDIDGNTLFWAEGYSELAIIGAQGPSSGINSELTTARGARVDYFRSFIGEVRSDANRLTIQCDVGDCFVGDVEVFLQIEFAESLTNAGGTIALDSIFYQGVFGTGGPGFTYSTGLLSGTVSAVPIPAAAWLFASGLGLLGWLRRRQAGKKSIGLVVVTVATSLSSKRNIFTR